MTVSERPGREMLDFLENRRFFTKSAEIFRINFKFSITWQNGKLQYLKQVFNTLPPSKSLEKVFLSGVPFFCGGFRVIWIAADRWPLGGGILSEKCSDNKFEVARKH